MRTKRSAPTLGLAAPALCGLVALLVLRLLVVKEFAIDEYTYGHAGWAIARGELPYRDFFFHHPPLLIQLIALAFLGLNDHPTNLLLVRFLMLPFLLLTGWACWRLNREWGPRVALLTPVLLFSLWPYTFRAVELRIDPAALALFLTSLALLPGEEGPGRSFRTLAAGACLGLAVWTSAKVLVYGCVFVAGFLRDVAHRLRRRRGPDLLGPPGWFATGFVLPPALGVGHLMATGTLDDFQRWCIGWAIRHETGFAGIPWTRYLFHFTDHFIWWLPLTLLGVAVSARRLRSRESPFSHRDALLLPLLVTTFLSFALQNTAYDYSLLPFLALFALFTARGIQVALRYLAELRARPSRQRVAVLASAGLGLLLALPLGISWTHLLTLPDNRADLEKLARIGELTEPDDPVYDNRGAAVTRPHVSYFFFTEDVSRALLRERLLREIPADLSASGCTLFVRDSRFDQLPAPLREFVFERFQPLDEHGEIWVWGRPFVRGDRPRLRQRFPVTREDRYFVQPEETLATGRLTLGGRPVTAPVVRLSPGDWEVEYEGEAMSFYLLWLPANGERVRPVPRATGFPWPLRYRGLVGHRRLESPP